MNKKGLSHKLGELKVPDLAFRKSQEVLDMKDPHYIIDRAVIYRDPRKLLIFGDLDDLVIARIVGKGNDLLPVSHDLDIPKDLGLRHRAALGISQESDSVAVVVSEETGGITVAFRGELQIRLSAEKLESILTLKMSDE